MIELGSRIEEVDVIFHLAARPGVGSSWQDSQWALQVNLMATKKLLHAIAQGARATRLVFASSSSVYGEAEDFPTAESELLRPISPYGVTKASAEQLINACVIQNALDVVILRYFSVFGPGQRPDIAFSKWTSAAMMGRPLNIYGDGEAIRDFTYVDDAAKATFLSADMPADTYNVAGGGPASVNESVNLIGHLAGRSLQIRHTPVARGDARRTGGDITITSSSGWSPRTRLSDGLRNQIEWTRAVPQAVRP